MHSFKLQKSLNQLFFILSLLVLSIILLPYANADGAKVYSVYDMDKDGYLDKIEYDKFFESKRKRSKVLDNWVFSKVDLDKDDKISEQEMVEALMENFKQNK